MRAAALAVLGALGLGACRSSEARRVEAEVLSVDRKIDALRAAPNEAKPTLLAALEQTACEAPKVCELKKVCVESYRTHLSAVAATGRARTLLAAPDGGVAASIEAARELTQAELLLSQSKTQTAKCASDQGELRRKVRER